VPRLNSQGEEIEEMMEASSSKDQVNFERAVSAELYERTLNEKVKGLNNGSETWNGWTATAIHSKH
jgi:hypothetical protein